MSQNKILNSKFSPAPRLPPISIGTSSEPHRNLIGISSESHRNLIGTSQILCYTMNESA